MEQSKTGPPIRIQNDNKCNIHKSDKTLNGRTWGGGESWSDFHGKLQAGAAQILTEENR